MEKEFAAFLLWSQSPSKKELISILSIHVVGQATLVKSFYITFTISYKILVCTQSVCSWDLVGQ